MLLDTSKLNVFRSCHLQDDAAAAQVVAPLALLAGCCRPLQLFAGRPGPAQWAGHAALLLLYLLLRLLLACGVARRCAVHEARQC